MTLDGASAEVWGNIGTRAADLYVRNSLAVVGLDRHDGAAERRKRFFVDLADMAPASMCPASRWRMAPGPYGYQRVRSRDRVATQPKPIAACCPDGRLTAPGWQ